jgi:excisionase family DNA binding protein
MTTINSAEERLMTVQEVAALLSSSVRQVWRLIAKGDLAKPVRVGRSARIPSGDWEAYLQKLRVERDAGSGGPQGKGGK